MLIQVDKALKRLIHQTKAGGQGGAAAVALRAGLSTQELADVLRGLRQSALSSEALGARNEAVYLARNVPRLLRQHLFVLTRAKHPAEELRLHRLLIACAGCAEIECCDAVLAEHTMRMEEKSIAWREEGLIADINRT